jgi:hypothetical protein
VELRWEKCRIVENYRSKLPSIVSDLVAPYFIETRYRMWLAYFPSSCGQLPRTPGAHRPDTGALANQPPATPKMLLTTSGEHVL